MKKALEVLNKLKNDRVIKDYAIGGAMGATFYLEPISTMDLDVFVLFKDDDVSLLPLQPIYEALKQMGHEADEHMRECVNVAGTPVQFLPAYNALLQEALLHAKSFQYDGVDTKVLPAEYLAAISVQTGRMKDRMRVFSFLEMDGFDRGVFEELISRFNLSERMKQWNG